MSLTERLDEDLKQALRAGDEVRKNTIRMLRASLKNQQIENRAPLDTQQELSVVQREVKRRREAAEEYRRVDRTDLAEKELAEAAVLETYLPEQLSDDELRGLVREAIGSTGATSPRDMGKVMSAVMLRVQGRADGRRVSTIAREMLSSEDAG